MDKSGKKRNFRKFWNRFNFWLCKLKKIVSHLQQKYHCIHKMPSTVLDVGDKKVYKTWFQSSIYILIGCTNQRRQWQATTVLLPGKSHVSMGEPGRLQSKGSLRVGQDWATSLSLFAFIQWRRKWQPTPVFLLGESQGQGSLVGCRLWGRTESDTTEAT